MFLFGFAPLILCTELTLFIILVLLVELEYYKWSTIVFLATLASVHYLMKINVLDYASNNPERIILAVGISLAIGIGWSLIRWICFLYKFKEARENRIEVFRNKKAQKDLQNQMEGCLNQGGVTTLYKSLDWELESEYKFLSVSPRYKKTKLTETPSYKDYRGQIVAWVVFWLPSMIGTLLNDFVRKLVTWIVNRFSMFYQYLSDKIVGIVPEKEG